MITLLEMQTDLLKAQKNARKLGVTVRASARKHKKLDVLRDGTLLHSIGDSRYGDYLTHGDKERQRLYRLRHDKHRHKVGSASWYSDQILWS